MPVRTEAKGVCVSEKREGEELFSHVRVIVLQSHLRDKEPHDWPPAMKFFKRFFAWSFRRKERPAKKKRVYAYRGANAGVKYTRKTTAPAPVLSGTRSDGTTISDTGTWPTPHMLAELGARRDDVAPSTPSIIEITKTRQEMLHSDRTLPRQQSTTAPISSPDESDENIYPESTQAVVGSPRRIPQSRDAVYSLSLPEESFGESFLSQSTFESNKACVRRSPRRT